MRISIKAATAGIALSVFGIAQMTAALASYGTYTVVNMNDRVAIQQVWFAQAGEYESPWLAADMDAVIAPGTQSRFDMTTGGNCFFDVKVRFSDGNIQTFDNVNVCRGIRLLAV